METVFTNNEAEITRLEGLYVVEHKPPATIRGVFLGVIGIVAECIRGPENVVVEGTAIELADVFGNGGKLRTALLNKPFGRLAVVRVPATGAALATDNAATTVAAVKATGRITATTVANLVDGQTFTIGDGAHTAQIFEIDKTGDGVTGGHRLVDVSAAVTAADVATIILAALVAAKVANVFGITATLNADPTKIDLSNDIAGVAGNVASSETVVNAAFVVTGMSGGTAATSTDIVQIDASGKGTWGNSLTYTIAAASDANVDHFNLTLTYNGKSKTYRNLDASTSANNFLAKLGDSAANWVRLTQLANGRPTNAADVALTGGADGTVVDTDYTATGKAIDTLAAHSTRIGYRFCAEYSTAAVKAKLHSAALASNFGLWGACPDAETTSRATAQTEALSFLTNDRLVYTFNHAYTVDPDTGTQIVTHPTAWLGSVLSQIDVDIHPGEADTQAILGRITKLYSETELGTSIDREGYIALKDAGVCALEHDGGFAFVSGVTTLAADGSNSEQITARRMADFLEHSIADFLKPSTKKKNTRTRRKSNIGAIKSYLGGLDEAERVVDGPEGEGYSVTGDEAAGNTADTRGEGIERIAIEVNTIKHALHIVLDATIGTTVKVSKRAA